MNLDEIIKQSEQTNGNFSDMSERAQALKFIFRQGSKWPMMSIPNKEALENMASNIAVLLEGDDNEAEIWDRIAGYARTRGLAIHARTRAAHGVCASAYRVPTAWIPLKAGRVRDTGSPGNAQPK